VRDHLGVVNGRHDGAAQGREANAGEQRVGRQLQRDEQQRHGEQWDEEGPSGHAVLLRIRARQIMPRSRRGPQPQSRGYSSS
jgi:hypothetical protein